MGIKKGENWGFYLYLQASRNEMLPGQIKAFGVGALLCRNDLYKNAVRYTLLQPPNNFMLSCTALQTLADFQDCASSAED